MKRLRLPAFACLILSCNILFAQQVIVPPAHATANRLSLNGTWTFKYFPASTVGSDSLFYEPGFNVAGWSNIKTPGHWELQGFAEPAYGKVTIDGTGLYRKQVVVPASWKGNPVYICFDGVLYGYTVWVNGRYAGDFASSYNRKVFDISKWVKAGETNTIAVRVSRLPKGWEFDTNDCWSLTGIFRDVTLFSLPRLHIRDIVVNTFVHPANATVTVKAMLKKTPDVSFSKSIQVSAKLLSPSGKLVKEFSLKGGVWPQHADTQTRYQEVHIDDPQLWTAETPDLYTLELELKDNGQLIQKHREKIGIREVGWSNSILTLNGKPIKLRGVNHHDLSPVNGRAITKAELLKDLTVARDANINYIRTSHYPPNPQLLDLCDSMGFYVMDEVPFGFGEHHMNDTAYLEILMTRAKATVARDKNHPSVIIWSVGNENPLTPVAYETGQYVKTLDVTRPICFPQIGSYFANNSKKFPDSIDIYAPHYPGNSALKEWPTRFNHPMIITEYAHSFGLDFDRMQEQWETMYATPGLAGGSVWHLFDQGILRKRTPKLSKEEAALYVWKDSLWYFDTGDINGIDGLVYADRTPQVDYWQVRKVYTPVKPLDDTLVYDTVKKTLRFRLNNRYDFTNLSAVQCSWQLVANNRVIGSGVSKLNCQPHDTTNVTINVTLPKDLVAGYCWLKLKFTNKRRYQFFEKVFTVQCNHHTPGLLNNLAIHSSTPVMNGDATTTSSYQFVLSPNGDKLQVKNKNGVALITDGFFARVNRKPTMAARLKKLNTFILRRQHNTVSEIKRSKLLVSGKYHSDSTGVPDISGNLVLNFSDSGYIQVNYQLVPDSSMKTPVLESGLSFLVPPALTELRWVGKGPYAAYPGKTALSEPGIYHLNSNDINFTGNREKVDCAIISDGKGNGFALIASHANIAVERTDEGILVSHNAFVGGRFNKGSLPEQYTTFGELKEISGSFYLVPLTGTWPPVLQKLFGPTDNVAKPDNPFYSSYDQ